MPERAGRPHPSPLPEGEGTPPGLNLLIPKGWSDYDLLDSGATQHHAERPLNGG